MHWIATSIIPVLTFLSSFSLEFLHLKWYFHASFSSFTLGSIFRHDCGRLLNITAWSKLRNATCSPRKSPRWLFVSHFVSTGSQGSPWVQHMRILRFIVTWAFSTNEKVWKLSVSTRALSSQRRRAVSVRFYKKTLLFTSIYSLFPARFNKKYS